MAPGPRFPREGSPGAASDGPEERDEPMCGIVGYVGEQAVGAHPGLRAEEARVPRLRLGGLAVVNGGTLNVVRATGKLKNLEARIGAEPPAGHAGHRPHPLGDPRPARPTRTRTRTPTRAWRWCTTASSRTTSS